MKKNAFYTNRLKTGFLAIIFIGLIIVLFTQVLNDTTYMAETGIALSWLLVVASIILTIVCLVLTFDSRPIVEFSSEGIKIRTFIFFEEFVPWEEVVGANEEKHSQRVVGMGSMKVTTYFFRIYRPNKRSLAINLTLLNQRGNEFNSVISNYLQTSA